MKLLSLEQAGHQLAQLLFLREKKLVLAESCTAGLVSATLAQTPGISRWLCGSAVVYQEATKSAWIGVSPATLQQWTAVSTEVAIEMATGVLLKTPQADIAASITGYLGPETDPPEMDGVAFMAIALRDPDRQPQLLKVEKIALGQPECQLEGQPENSVPDGPTQRVWRQRAAASKLLLCVAKALTHHR